MHMCRDWPVATRVVAIILDVRPMQDRVDPSWLLNMVMGRSKQILKKRHVS